MTSESSSSSSISISSCCSGSTTKINVVKKNRFVFRHSFSSPNLPAVSVRRHLAASYYLSPTSSGSGESLLLETSETQYVERRRNNTFPLSSSAKAYHSNNDSINSSSTPTQPKSPQKDDSSLQSLNADNGTTHPSEKIVQSFLIGTRQLPIVNNCDVQFSRNYNITSYTPLRRHRTNGRQRLGIVCKTSLPDDQYFAMPDIEVSSSSAASGVTGRQVAPFLQPLESLPHQFSEDEIDAAADSTIQTFTSQIETSNAEVDIIEAESPDQSEKQKAKDKTSHILLDNKEEWPSETCAVDKADKRSEYDETIIPTNKPLSSTAADDGLQVKMIVPDGTTKDKAIKIDLPIHALPDFLDGQTTISSVFTSARIKKITSEEKLQALGILAPSLQKILKRFPPSSEIARPGCEDSVHFSYKLETVINWGAHGVVYQAEVIVNVPKAPIEQQHQPLNEALTRLPDIGLQQRNLQELLMMRKKEPELRVSAMNQHQNSSPSQSVTADDVSNIDNVSEDKRKTNFLLQLNRFFRSLRKNSQTSAVDDLKRSEEETTTKATQKSEPSVVLLKSATTMSYPSSLLTKIPVALKIVSTENDCQGVRDELERVSLEVALLSEIDHPSIARFIESFTLPPSYCIIVQEFLVGSVQRMYADFGPLPEPIIASVVYDILSALVTLHESLGPDTVCIHRDIKPSNILISSKGVAKLVDFGVATLNPRYSKCHTYAGTPQYMAPEAVRSHELGVDCKTDIWSVGMTTLEMAQAGLHELLEPENSQKLLENIGWNEKFIPALEDGYFPAGRLGVKKFATGTLDSVDRKRLSVPATDLKKESQTFSHAVEIDSATTPDMRQEAGSSEAESASEQYSMVHVCFSPELKDFISACLKRNSNQRPSAKELLKHPFLSHRQRFDNYRQIFIHLLKNATSRPKILTTDHSLLREHGTLGSRILSPSAVKSPPKKSVSSQYISLPKEASTTTTPLSSSTSFFGKSWKPWLLRRVSDTTTPPTENVESLDVTDGQKMDEIQPDEPPAKQTASLAILFRKLLSSGITQPDPAPILQKPAPQSKGNSLELECKKPIASLAKVAATPSHLDNNCNSLKEFLTSTYQPSWEISVLPSPQHSSSNSDESAIWRELESKFLLDELLDETL